MDISRQVFSRSVRMGISYVILSVIMGTILTSGLNAAVKFGGLTSTNGSTVSIGSALGFLIVPMGALAGLVITTPVYLLFVADKNAGVLEYLLAVGMNQRDLFLGYLKASLMLSLLALAPVVALNIAFMNGGLAQSLLVAGLAVGTGLADVALVTVLMTAFSSMQRRPTGMNSPVGITIGVFLLIPEVFLLVLLGSEAVWVDGAVALVLILVALGLISSLDRLIQREKLLP